MSEKISASSVEANQAPVTSSTAPPTVEQASASTSAGGATGATDPPSIKQDVKPPSSPIVSLSSSPISRLFHDLPSIIQTAGHSEMWGVELKDSHHIPTTIVLEKFLRANANDVTKAKAQLNSALQWRKEAQPGKALDEKEFDTERFGGLGFVTLYEKEQGREVVTWNIYGNVKDVKGTFGHVEEFIRWRAALMELSIRELKLNAATEAIPDGGEDPYKMIQVHDYHNISFLRMDPTIRVASKKVIEVFGMAYPELLRKKFFVNVPAIMGWVFTSIKLFLSAETVKKFHPLGYGRSLAGELPEIGEQLPKDYGGQGKNITEGLTVRYAGVTKVAEAKGVL